MLLAILDRVQRLSDLFAKNRAGHNALDLAVAKGHEATVETLANIARIPVEWHHVKKAKEKGNVQLWHKLQDLLERQSEALKKPVSKS